MSYVVYLVIAGVLSFALVYFLTGREGKDGLSENAPDTFEQARKGALRLRAADLGILPASASQITAAVMETSYPEGTVTLVCKADGTSGLHFSNGGGSVQSEANSAVAGKAFEFVENASKYRSHFKPSPVHDLPPAGDTQFFLVSDAGVVRGGTSENVLQSGSHPLGPLYRMGQEVLTELRMMERRHTRA